MSAPPLFDLRERLKSGRAALAAAYLEMPAASRYLTRHAALVDGVLFELSTRLGLPPDFCIAAVGGYGRGELFPGSDVDVLMLLPAEPTDGQQSTLENWVQACWDVGLEIGHSVRTVEACITEADADITVFDPAKVIDNATFTEPTKRSTGISEVLVNGTFVVRNEALVPGARPGRPVRIGGPTK